MERTECESVRLFCPEPTDELIRREAFERLQPARKIVSGDEVPEMPPQFGVRFVEVAFDRRVLDRAVHALDLPIGPRMLRLRQPMVDVVAGACELEGVRAESPSLDEHLLDLRRAPSLAGGVSEMNSIVGEHRMDLVGNRLDQSVEKVRGCLRRGSLMQFDEGEL